ncbi:hypothetical protein H6P81_011087 [Aristolochia fimbriata]|uniref:Uncharacterized protein n=1 Tax=Aristolochia fimbriata TaxID=158543 RepID=A0AAV7EU07_ARIFI|nr:hypothetical protein H6P81_011087 [Aristolochia fimbriata]
MSVLVPALSLMLPCRHGSSKIDAADALIPTCRTRVTRKTSRVSRCPPSARPERTNPVLQRASLRQQIYTYPDPIPEFAVAETRKFRIELLKRLSKYKDFGGDVNAVVDICAEIFSSFLHKEYGGPGTLVVEPFTDMLLALKDKKLPGAPVAARTALLWAQNHVDRDWEAWTSSPPR